MATAAVVIPVYAKDNNNRLDLLGQTLRSARLQQSAVPIVVDDGSPVDLEAFIRNQGFRSIRYVRREWNPGDLKTASNALNFGIDVCLDTPTDVTTPAEVSGLEAVSYMHSDNLLPVDSVWRRLASLGNSFVHTDTAYVDVDNNAAGVRTWVETENAYRDRIQALCHWSTMWTVAFLEALRVYVGEKFCQPGVFDSLLSHENLDTSINSARLALEMGLSPTPFS